MGSRAPTVPLFLTRDSPPIGRTGSHTDILFFRHRPEHEWQNQQFVRHHYATHREVVTAFYERARTPVDESGLPVSKPTDGIRRGSGFAERITNAILDAFAQGYDQVLVVGRDCPRLVANNGGPGMPNVRNDDRGVLTRISTSLAPFGRLHGTRGTPTGTQSASPVHRRRGSNGSRTPGRRTVRRGPRITTEL